MIHKSADLFRRL